MRTNLVRPVAVLAVAASASLAIAAPAVAAPTGRKTVSVGVTKSHIVKAASTLRPGLVHIRNTSGHYVAIFGKRSRNGTTSRLAKDLNSTKVTISAVLKDFSVLTELMPHGNVYLPMAKGTYYLLDDEVDKYSATKIHTVSVHGSTVNAKAPAATPAVIERNHSLYTKGALPRHGYLHAIDHAAGLSEVAVIGVGKSVSDATVRDFLAKPTLGKIDDLKPTTLVETGPQSPGRSSYVPFAGAPGRYVLIALTFRSHKAPTVAKGAARLAHVK